MTQRQEEIITASINLISEKGIQGLTIKNLSKEIHISEPAIYRHFESKADILIHLLDNFKNMVLKTTKAIQNDSGSSWYKIHKLLIGYYTKFAETPSLVAVIFAEEIFKNEKVLSKKILEILNMNENILLTLIDEGQKNGELRNDVDKKYIAVLIIGSLRFLVKKWELNNNNFNILKEGENLLAELDKLLKK